VKQNTSIKRDDQTRRTARVLEIIQQIAVAPGRWSRHSLAQHHEISERMIQKDLELIRYRLGLNLNHDGSGYSFDRLPHLPTATYSFSEALALLIAARTAQVSAGVNSTELAAAIARLESIFPDELRPMLREATEQLPRTADKSHRQAMMALFHRALVERLQVCILYATPDRQGQAVERVVEPYQLMPYGRSWHLIAYDHLRESVLQFKLDRVQEAAIQDIRYIIPDDFDLDEYLGDAWGLMRGSAAPAEEVILLFEPEAGRWVSEETWHKSQQNQFLENGRIRVSFHVGVTPEMVSWLMYYGDRVLVEKPDWLREEVRENHQRAAGLAEVR
jgi:predicted DNA-binding transcriptional regulator YafY